MKLLVDRLSHEHILSIHEYRKLIENCDGTTFDYLRQKAVSIANARFGSGIYVRGLLEISSYCRNNCFYCGLRHGNKSAKRYRLTDEAILSCCEYGYNLGLRTFVLQGGEDVHFSDERLEYLIKMIRSRCSQAAITLSLGERSKESYQKLFNAGARRYLLRHEAASEDLYRRLHPDKMSLNKRLSCIRNLKEIGYQVGMGMMIGAPGQTIGNLIEDLFIMRSIEPHMIGVGPFIPHVSTPYANEESGDIKMTLIILSILRLMFPDALIPATTALSTLDKTGRLQGILSGANVVMPNLSPIDVRDKYSIYNNKLSIGAESVECLNILDQELNSIGYHIDYSIGNHKNFKDE